MISAPDTKVGKQKSRHKPALWGIGAVVVFAGTLFAGLMRWLAHAGNEPRDADVKSTAAPEKKCSPTDY